MQKLIRSAQKTLVTRKIAQMAPVLSQIHCTSSLLLNNTQIFNFCSSQGNSEGGYERVSSYENLISRISSSDSINDILKLFSVNEQLLKNEHIVLCLRMLARLLRATNQSDIENLSQDPRYQALTQKACEAIETLNEYETLDFLFWMRKFRIARIDLNMNEEAKEKFYGKVSEFLKSKSFNFRNLVNLYYDYSFINRNSQEICFEILRELKTDRKLLTPFTIIQILQAASRKNNYRQTQELMLADYVTRNFTNLLDEFDTDQKCVIFKYLAELEMSYNPPKFKVPQILYILRNHLKEKLDQLSESSVINILNAYQKLPKEFPNDLIEEIKEMVIVTIQHNSQNIKTFFLLEFIESIQNVKRRRLDNKQAEILAEELKSRIMYDEYLQKTKNIERLINIYDNGMKQRALYDAIEEYVKKSDKKVFIASVYEFLARRSDKNTNMEQFMEPLLKEMNLQNLGAYPAVRLFLLLNFLPESSKYQEQIDILKPQVEEIMKTSQGRLINIFKVSTIFGNTRKQYLDTAINQIQEWFVQNKGKLSFQEEQNFYKNLILSIELKEQKNNWIEWLNNNAEIFNQESCSRFIDCFFQLQNQITIDQFLVFFHFLSLNEYKNVPYKKLQFAMKDASEFVFQLLKYENLFKRFTQILITLNQQQPENIRLQYIYGFTMRVFNMNHRSQLFIRFLKKSFDLYKENSKEQEQNQYIQFIFSQLLLDLDALQGRYALEIYDKNVSGMQDINIRAKYLSYIIQHSNAEFRDSKQEQIRSTLEQLGQQLNSTNTSKVMNSLVIFLSFPSQYIEENKDILLKTTKEFINQTNDKLYIKLINSLTPRYVNKHYDLYFPFIKEIINAYPKYRKRLTNNEITEILGKFVSLNCKYPSIYNYILEDIGLHFNYLTAEQRVKCMSHFSTLQIKQTDFFEKNLQQIQQQSGKFKGYLNIIINSLYKIGYDQQSSVEMIQKIVEDIKRNDSVEEAFHYIKYLPVLQAENEAEQLAKWMEALPAERNQTHEKYKNKGEIVLLNEFFTRIYPQNPDFAKKIRNFIDENDEQFAKSRENFFNPTNQGAENNVKYVGEFLNAMKVEHKIFEQMNGLLCDIIIPSQKIIIKIIQARDTNFDRYSFSGKVAILNRIYKSLDPEYKVILLNNIEFRSSQDDISKVNLLVSDGVKSNVEGEYDFSQITRQEKNNKRIQQSDASASESEMDDLSHDEQLNLKQ